MVLRQAEISVNVGDEMKRWIDRMLRPAEHEDVVRVAFSHNVHGDFYVEDGCCTSCGMPSTVAPELFSYAPDGHCYVSKQPSSAIEVRQMIEAFEVQDIGCIRYKGKNRVIQIKLVASGEGDQCDSLDQDLTMLIEEVKRDRWGLKK